MKSFRKFCTGAMGAVIGVTSVIVIPLATASPAGATGTGGTSCTPDTGFTNCVRYTYTGADDSFSVPAGVTSVRTKLWGGGGGGAEPAPGSMNGGGGGGGFTVATLAVTPLASLSLMVGEQGIGAGTTAAYGGGAVAGTAGYSFLRGGSGGGMSAIFSDITDATPLLIAGGGGGAGAISLYPNYNNNASAVGGGGGGGLAATGTGATAYYGGPGTQLAGGDAATTLDTSCSAATAGSQYSGGAGGNGTANNDQSSGGGGGGGGYYGGGGGACGFDDYQNQQYNVGGAGGGGSAYVSGAGVSDAATTAGASAVGFGTNAAAAGSSDPLYDVGTGQGGSFQNGGSGEIVLEWSVPAGPTAAPLTSNGTGLAGQTAQVVIPAGGSVTLLDGTIPTDTISIFNEGIYLLDPNSGQLFFSPAPGFTGIAGGVTYKVTDAYGQPASSTFTPTVALPASPTLLPITTSGQAGAGQTKQLTVPGGGSLNLLSGTTPVTTLVVQGQGTYTVSPATGTVTFTPAAGFIGKASPVTLRLTDSYGRSADATYIATVLANKVLVSATAPARVTVVTTGQILPVVCKLTVRKVGRCDVVLVYRNTRGSYVVGTGSMTSPQADGTVGQLVTQVRLNAAGTYLAGIATIPTWVYAAITPYGSLTALNAVTRTALVSSNLK